jgi:hypothetical protein
MQQKAKKKSIQQKCTFQVAFLFLIPKLKFNCFQASFETGLVCLVASDVWMFVWVAMPSGRLLLPILEDAYDGGRPYINSVSGLKTYAHLAEEGVLDGTESPPRSARLLGRGETAPVTTVSRTVNQSTKVIDLTGH